MEIRQIQTPLEIREVANQPPKIVGYACFWNTPSIIQDVSGRKFRETFRKNAFGYGEVFGLVGHDIKNILNTRSAGTLAVEEHEQGLYFEMTLPNTTLGRDTLENTRAGNYKGASVGFNVIEDKWDFKNGEPSVEIIKASLGEISLTPIPAHKSSVSIRMRPIGNLVQYKMRLWKMLIED
jgi:HK97 family phage prohead protease